MACPDINNGCLKLKELNKKAENLDRAENSSAWGIFENLSAWGIFENLSAWGISKHNGSYVHSLCLSGSYENCVMRK